MESFQSAIVSLLPAHTRIHNHVATRLIGSLAGGLTRINRLPPSFHPNLVPIDRLVPSLLLDPHRQHVPILDQFIERRLGALPGVLEGLYGDTTAGVVWRLGGGLERRGTDGREKLGRGGDLMIGLETPEARKMRRRTEGARAGDGEGSSKLLLWDEQGGTIDGGERRTL
jgi:hypothetical protein